MDNTMIVEGLKLLTNWLYPDEKESMDDCKRYLETHEAQERSLTFALAVIVDIVKQFREGDRKDYNG